MPITVQQMRDICTELIDAGLGDMPIVDFENDTQISRYAIDRVWADKEGTVFIDFDEVKREAKCDS